MEKFLWALAWVSAMVAVVAAISYAFVQETDLTVYRLGGAHLLSPNLYTAQLHSSAGPLLFTYPPFAALVFWPLAHLPVVSGQAVWNTLNVLSLVGALAFSIRAARGRPLTTRDWRLALLLTAPALFLWPVRDDFGLGQIELILMVMILGDLTCAIEWRGRTLPRGVLTGLAAAVKLTPLVFILYLVVTGQRRAAAHATAAFMAATAAVAAITPRNS
ncbi:MAG TPA: glycosyltransferase family 87 protein [Acidimicrobiales bacterium]